MVTAPSLDRLRRAVTEHARRPATPDLRSPTSITPSDALAQILRGEWLDTPRGPVFVRDDWLPADHAHGAVALSAVLAAPCEALGHIAGGQPGPQPARLAFFDIETTGLSGGTGTYVVLAGVGSFEEGGFRLRQYFLASVGNEAAMLAALAADLARFDGVVTYNGRAFDVPLMETRLALARIAPPFGGMAHLDLLHAVRRLYAHRMPGCRLAEAERRLLRIERFDDIPGSLIPSLYFAYARAGQAAPLRAVFRHNAEDVLSLAGVLATVAGLLSASALDPDDAVAVARWWERAGAPERALRLYREALPWLDGGEDWPWAAARTAALFKRAGLRDDAVPIWERLWANGERRAGLELAMHFEHRARDHARAADVTLRLLKGAPPADVEPLERRLARIQRKAARLAVAGADDASG